MQKLNDFGALGWHLGDPCNRNHKSLAIGNHDFEIANFSRRNRSKIAVSQSQKIALGQKMAAIRAHTLVVATISGNFLTYMTLLKHYKNHKKTGESRVQRLGFRGCFLSPSDSFELHLQSLAICDFEVAAIRVT